jgi:hypothetical protein
VTRGGSQSRHPWGEFRALSCNSSSRGCSVFCQSTCHLATNNGWTVRHDHFAACLSLLPALTGVKITTFCYLFLHSLFHASSACLGLVSKREDLPPTSFSVLLVPKKLLLARRIAAFFPTLFKHLPQLWVFPIELARSPTSLTISFFIFPYIGSLFQLWHSAS